MSKHTLFLRINFITLTAVYLLILVGAVVRSLGAGMGCPDWPKCFGSYVPPLEVSELPANYEGIFLEERTDKNNRLVNLLEDLGFDRLSEKIANDPMIAKTEPFNATKAWIEYINRLLGVIIGLLILANMIMALIHWTTHRMLGILGVGVFVLVGFQGWVGSLVVATNLLPGFITFHMLLALLIVALLLVMRVMSQHHGQSLRWNLSGLKGWLLLLFILLIPQITMGTLTREEVDLLLKQGVDRSLIVGDLDAVFLIHRSYSWVLVFLSSFIFWRLQNTAFAPWGWLIVCIVVAEVLVGAGLSYLGLPVWIQPIHLMLATLLFGAVFYLFLHLHKRYAVSHN